MARKFDKYGFEILEDEEPLDYTSIDEDDGDLIDNERRWYEDDDYLEEEISILLVVNVPQLEHLDITNNPITHNKEAFDNIEYEIFKSKNMLLTNNAIYKKIKTKSTNKIIEALRNSKASLFTICNKSSKTWQLLYLGYFIYLN